MRRIPIVVIALALGFGVLALNGHAADTKKESVETLMKKKLVESQKVLEGIALGDFDKIAKHAENLQAISKKAEWKVLETPLFAIYSTQFQGNAEDMVKYANKKNLDAAALSYVELTLTCVKCHKHVREKRIAGDAR